jgi:predicted transcriptional regulator
MVIPAQIRAARALLGLSQVELAKMAGISPTALVNIETGASDPKTSTLTAIIGALESAGAAFTNGDEPGVKLRLER